ncbi:MAG: transcriptional regulator [Haloferacaceae archaeon]
MAQLNELAKRVHNVSPAPVRLTVDGETHTFRFSGTEFFQREFRAEGRREGDDAAYRLITSEDNASLLVGRRAADGDGWSLVGEVSAVERVDG